MREAFGPRATLAEGGSPGVRDLDTLYCKVIEHTNYVMLRNDYAKQRNGLAGLARLGTTAGYLVSSL